MAAPSVIDQFTRLTDIPEQDGILRRVGTVIDFLPEDTFSLSTDFAAEVTARITGDNTESAARVAADALLTPTNGIYATSVEVAQSSRMVGDSQDRWQRDSSGKISWGSGAAAPDVSLYRQSPGMLAIGNSTQIGELRLYGTSTTHSLLNLRRGTDAVDRFNLRADGKHEWTDGVNAADADLFRHSTLRLGTTSAFRSTRTLTSSTAFEAAVGSDVIARFAVAADGKISWGTGAVDADVNLYRGGIDTLSTDDSFTSGGSLLSKATNNALVARSLLNAGSTALVARISTDPTDRFTLFSDGKHVWGDGTNAADADLFRASAAKLQTSSSFEVRGNLLGRGATSQLVFDAQNSTANAVVASRVSGDAQSRFSINTDGKVQWGSGALTPDTNLYRYNPGILATDSSLYVRGNFIQTDHNAYLGGTTYFGADGGAGPWDTTLTRTAAGSLATNGRFSAVGDIQVVDGASTFVARTANSSTITRFVTNVSGDIQDRFQILADGKHRWGDGANTVDTNIYRTGVNALRTDGAFSTGGSITSGSATTSTNGFIALPTVSNAFKAAQVAGNVFLANRFLDADANAAFVVFGDGKHEWGAGGAIARDTNLYRIAAGILKTDGQLFTGGNISTQQVLASSSMVVTRTTSTAPALVALVSGDTQNRISVDASGRIQWGSGAAAADTTIQRNSAGVIQGSTYLTSQASASSAAFRSGVGGDTVDRFTLSADGKHGWGPGSGAQDTTLSRWAAGWLMLGNATQNGRLGISSASATNASLGIRIGADTLERFVISGDGKHQWGDGANAVDVFMYRGGADLLRTDDQFSVQRPVSSDWAYLAHVNGDAQYRYRVDASGKIEWGDGTNARDVFMYRGGAGLIQHDGEMRAKTTATAFAAIRPTSLVEDFNIAATGVLAWGDGTNSRDVNLYRSAADTLSTDDTFSARQVVVTQTSGIGFLELREQAVDAVNNADRARIFARDDGTGKTQLCVRFGSGVAVVLATEA